MSQPRSAKSDRAKFADDLTFMIGRYHDEDGVDRRYAKAARLLREADAEIADLKQRHDPATLYATLKDAANIEPGTDHRWLPLTTIAAVLGIEGEYQRQGVRGAA